ncbi:DoxX family protein [Spirosoma foliorum]|uniref:DoxX family protein n=1 Tax=Spirosoma foliorum TaxID=2710596 RepID=A0A7G5GTQ1_9BACT|nr:DoxX family protein [Spirosoma foliorum]QMW02243.1 DoxX family protein [Spirosoma foliorum]
MTTKTKNSISWVLSGLIGLMLSASAIDKIMGSGHALQMSALFGLSARTYSLLGIIEILSVFLFLYPRTGILGTLLLSSYLGGAIATHLQHQQAIAFPAAIEVFVWITAIIRFPELSRRLTINSAENNLVTK